MSEIHELPISALWADDENYTSDVSGNPWRTGSAPTKVEPPASVVTQGEAPDAPLAAEHANWRNRQLDDMRNALAIDSMLRVHPQIDLGRNNDTSLDDFGFGSERFAGAWSTRRKAYLGTGQESGSVIYYRQSDGRLLGRISITGTTANQPWVRGGYTDSGTAATSFVLFMAPGFDEVVRLTDAETKAQVITSLGTIDCQPVQTAPGTLAFLAHNGSIVALVSITTSGISTVSTGLAWVASSTWTLRYIGSRLWAIGPERAAYSDNNGASWSFDGAATTPVTAGEFVFYDPRGRWVRIRRSSVAAVRVSNEVNRPSNATALKTIDNLSIHDAVQYGRTCFALGEWVAGRTSLLAPGDVSTTGSTLGVLVSPDYGITWYPTTARFRNDDPALAAQGPGIGYTVPNAQISASPAGIAARFRNDVGTAHTRIICATWAQLGGAFR